MRIKSPFIIFTSFFALSLMVLTSCTKESIPTVGVVIVVDQQKNPILMLRWHYLLTTLASNRGATPMAN